MQMLFTIIPRLSLILSDGKLLYRLQLLASMYWFVITRKTRLVRSEFSLRFYRRGSAYIFYVQQPMDLRALAEVFIDHEYTWEPTPGFAPNVILDLGAHIGDTALYYHFTYPEARIIAVEASPSSYARLTKNVQHINNITPVFAAVGPFDGEVSFNVSESSLGSSLLNRQGIESSVLVPQITLDTLLKQYGVEKADLIKFDIEGGEFSLFARSNPAEYALAYRGELHFDLADETIENFTRIFSNFVTRLEPMRKEGRYLFSAIGNN